MSLKQNCTLVAWKAEVVLTLILMCCLPVCAQSTVVFRENFESGSHSFLINNDYGIGNGLWHHSTSCKVSLPGHTQGGALYFGQNDTCDYDTGRAGRGIVETPPIDLTRFAGGTIELRFKYYLEVELVNCRSLWDPEFGIDTDLATVAISADEMPFSTIARNCWKSGLAELPSTPDGWAEFVVDISDFAGSIVQLQFGFNTVSNSQNYYDGFYIDDIVVYGPSCDYNIAGDANGDCVVDMLDFVSVADLAIFAQNWLLNCYLTPSDPGCIPK